MRNMNAWFKRLYLYLFFAILLQAGTSIGQTFNFKSSEASGIRTASQLAAHGLPDTIKVWCNDWSEIMIPPTTYGTAFKLKSNNAVVKFYIDHFYPKTQLPYTYQLVYTIYGCASPGDSTLATIGTDTLTITNFNHADPKNAHQDIQLAKYSNYYKTMVVIQHIFVNPGGTPTTASLSDVKRQNFNIESSILTQRYDKTNYGIGSSLQTTATPDATNQILNVSFNLPGGTTPVQLTPVNFELEWTYIDDYKRDVSSGSISSVPLSSLQYSFKNNNTRVWLDSSHYRIPLIYPNGYIAYRVRMVRPDSSLFKYPIYSDWSYSIADAGSLNTLNSSHPTAVYHISDAYSHDSLNWQYTISFAEGGKYKHVVSFFDGLLKNRESITRFNSNLNKLLVTKSVYDFEGRPSIKTLPAIVGTSSFSFQHNVDINSVTGLPYRASDFDTGFHICPGDPILAPFATTALANIYYSSSNPDMTGYQRYVPDAGGFPLVQTIYSPAFNDRVEKQGGAGPRFQVSDSNIISNYYVTTGQRVLNTLFGLNAGWNNYYNMTVSRDPNMQLSMSINNYEGKQMASALIGPGGSPIDHAIDPVNVPPSIYYQEDILKSLPQSVIDNRKIADKDFFNEVEGNDSIRYTYQFSPYPVCPDQFLSVRAHYFYNVTDQCGDTVFAQDSTLGITGVVSTPVAFSGAGTLMHLNVGPYSVHKELAINPGDVEAALDSFFAAPPNCLKDEPWFIRQAVESKKFPCPDAIDDPCAIKKAQMLKDMYPGGLYGCYTVSATGAIIGTRPSIFEWHMGPDPDAPPDTTGGPIPYPHFTYQDSCLLIKLPDTITIGGIDYYHLRTMPVDSFIKVYNLAIAAGDNSIAEALLPLHPEYCALKACMTDTFKTLLLALPNAQVADDMHLLYLDSIIAHDPLVGILSAYPSTADSLATYPGGHVRLDYPELIKLYCGCSDSVMLKECALNIFKHEIDNKLLVNDYVKNGYFKDMINLYLMNRERYVHAYMETGAGDSCALCASSRLPLADSTHWTFPHVITGGGAPSPSFLSGSWTSTGTTGTWLLGAMSSIGAPLDSTAIAEYTDSASSIYTAADSAFCHGQVDSIVARLNNCSDANPVVLTSIRNTLDSLCSAHVVPGGNYTPEMIRYAIVRSGATINDLCNPYLVSFGLHPATAAGSESCKPDLFYTQTAQYLNKKSVLNALIHPGTSYYDTLRYWSNDFEAFMYHIVGDNAPVRTKAAYDASNSLYTLSIFKDPALGLPIQDTVKIYLRGTDSCAGIFVGGASGDSLSFANVVCTNTISSSMVSGFINQFSFVATVLDFHGMSVTTCHLLGWTDSVETMAARDNNIAACVPCTEMRKLYTEFADTMAAYGIVGSDHPLYEPMLIHFMNYKLPNSYSFDQYSKFITSCALADSMFMPLYVGYGNLKFDNVAHANTFLSLLNVVDTDVTFDGVYRDSSAAGVTVSVDFNIPPAWELYKYKNFISSYSGAGMSAKVINARLDSLQGDSVLGFIYAYPGTAIPSPSTIFGSGGTITFSAPQTRGIWMGTYYVPQDFYYVKFVPGTTKPYEISSAVYEMERYFYNNSLSATLISNYQSTVNQDYFKVRKTEYLKYAYKFQQLPSYTVLDSLQANNLVDRIPGYAGSDATYSHPFNPYIITNLYLSDPSMVNSYFDTLKYILETVATDNIVTPGSTFFDTNKVVIHTTIDSPLIAYRCSDGTYWYRYFGHGDTLYNVYVAMPKWIPRRLHKYYQIISIGPPTGIMPALGDSNSRYFTLNLRKFGSSAIVQAKGMTTFVIAKNQVLKDVLLGNPLTTVSAVPPTDTFNNCERNLLTSGIREGIVNYRNYMDSVRAAIRGGFMDYMMANVKEQLILGYQTNEFNYTLYNYDRAGNLSSTVPPAGVTPLSSSTLDGVDDARTAGASTSTLIPAHDKVSKYNYNSINQVVVQTTPDAGDTRFFYDAAGRLICSQNAKQTPQGYCTYNLYDNQNRIIETGEAKLLCPYFAEIPITSGTPLPSCYYTYPGYIPGTTIASPYSPVIKRIKTMPQDSIRRYIRALSRRDVVVTIYDTAAANLYAINGLDAQENLRKRVSCAKYFENLAAFDTVFKNYTYATHYSYDIEGNVKSLIQDFPSLDYLKERYKRVDYDYDLISGKVNLLSYNRSFADQYYQRYSYDDDNRITKVETSADGLIWHRDAEYSYYQHGPLARIDVGDLRVQGIDYAYTIQGWLKIMNSDSMSSANDMGRDADVTINAKDAVAFSIDYFKDDYKPISSWTPSHVQNVSRNLYNGNIARQTMAIADFRRLNKQYVYDQLNRIKNANYATAAATDGALTATSDYRNNYTYDADGNIQTIVRYGNNTGTGALIMDSLFYSYGAGIASYSKNQLRTLADKAADSYSNDIKYNLPSVPMDHYKYDGVGNTIKDLISGQDTIKWNLYNKVTETRNNSGHNYMNFKYDAAGNRVAKYVTTADSSGNTEQNNYYVRDAQGNILAIYRENIKYKTKTVSLFNGIRASAYESGVTATDYTHFVWTEVGTDATFTSSIFGYSVGSPDFTSWVRSKPVSYFMNADASIYTDMVLGNLSYMPSLVGHDTTTADSILSSAALSAASVDLSELGDIFKGILMNADVSRHMLDVMCSVGADDIVLGVASRLTQGQYASCTDAQAALGVTLDNAANNPRSSNQVISAILNTAVNYPDEFATVMRSLVYDSYIYQYQNFQGLPTFLAGLQETVYDYGDQAKVTNFFDQFGGSSQLLMQVAGDGRLLQTCYNVDPESYFLAFDSIVGPTYVDSALASIPVLPLLPFVNHLSAATDVLVPHTTTVTYAALHTFGLAEHDIYGSSRVGVKNYWPGQVGLNWDYDHSIFDTVKYYVRQPWYSMEYQDIIKDTARSLFGSTHTNKFVTQHMAGQKQYEVVDHLGDVLATLSDSRMSVPPTSDSTTPYIIASYAPVLKSAHDYYPFGMYMPGRYTEDTQTHCATTTALVTVPVTTTTWVPWGRSHEGTYAIGGGTLTDGGNGGLVVSVSGFGDGAGIHFGTGKGVPTAVDLSVAQASIDFVVYVVENGQTVIASKAIATGSSGVFSLDFSSVATTVDLVVSSTSAIGGGILVNGHWVTTTTTTSKYVTSNVCSEDQYRYGHNGQMKVNEVAGIGNHNTALFWEQDPRAGRRWNTDVKPNTSISPYATFNNNPLEYSDVRGDSINTNPKFWWDKDGHRQEWDNSKESREQRAKFEGYWGDYVKWLRDNGFGSYYDQLKNSRAQYVVNFDLHNASGFNYDPGKRGGIISWNPYGALLTQPGGIVLSPITVLSHEMGHAFDLDVDPIKHKRDVEAKCGDGTSNNEEEMKEINGIEQKVAEKLGEVKKGQKTRSNHGGSTVPVDNPRSHFYNQVKPTPAGPPHQKEAKEKKAEMHVNMNIN